MKLLTHNMLACNKPACAVPGVVNFPLRIVVREGGMVRDEEAEFNPDFLVGMLPRLEYPALLSTARELGVVGLPDAPPADCAGNEEFLRALHEALMVVNIVEGVLVCPHCGREFAVSDGIPNMLLNEEELA